MLRFLDGPAAGQVLACQRAPLFLRCVQNSVGEWDALDQLDDDPEPFERIEVYQLHGQTGSVHYHGVNAKTGKRFGRTEMTGDYRYVDAQPSDQIKRERELWQAWATGRKKLLLEAAQADRAGVSGPGSPAGEAPGVADNPPPAGVDQGGQDANSNPG